MLHGQVFVMQYLGWLIFGIYVPLNSFSHMELRPWFKVSSERMQSSQGSNSQSIGLYVSHLRPLCHRDKILSFIYKYIQVKGYNVSIRTD